VELIWGAIFKKKLLCRGYETKDLLGKKYLKIRNKASKKV
jgi:hypothetical protein